MAETPIDPAPRTFDPSSRQNIFQWQKWFEQVARALGRAGSVAWSLVNKSGSNLTDIETRNHSGLQNILALDPTDTDATKVKHLSNAQGKVWQDHVGITNGNPHGTDHSALDSIGTLDVTSADTTKDKHLSNAQGKKWEDHTADTSNPHSVTKTQVGLGNVTDDAQLKRAAGDIGSFDLKATPVSNDVLLVEDSADLNAKKKITVGSLPYISDAPSDGKYYVRKDGAWVEIVP